MSGHYQNYPYFHLEQLADDIEEEFKNDGKEMIEDFSPDNSLIKGKKFVETDRFENASQEQKTLILSEIRCLILELRIIAERVRLLDKWMDGDNGIETYIEKLNEHKHK